jgi:hypothetical protein
MVITRERSNNKNPVDPKTDSVSSTRSSSHRDGRSSTASTDSSTSSGDIATTACRKSDWRSVKRSMKGLWKSVVGV